MRIILEYNAKIPGDMITNGVQITKYSENSILITWINLKDAENFQNILNILGFKCTHSINIFEYTLY